MRLFKDVNIHIDNKRASRLLFAFLLILYALVCTTKNCFTAALADIKAEEIFTFSQAAFIPAAFYIVYTPLQVLGGVFADRLGSATLILIGLVGSAAANVVIYFNSGNYYVMLFAWIFSAVVQAALWPAVFKCFSSQLWQSDRPIMLFLMSFASSGGFVVSYLLAFVLPKWQDNFIVSALILLALALLLLLFAAMLNPKFKRDERPIKEAPVADQEAPKKVNALLLFLSSGFLISLPAAIARYMVDNSAKSFVPAMLDDCYAGVGEIGELLTILVVLCGIAGVLTVRLLLYPRLFKNEFTCTLFLLLSAIPFTVLLTFVKYISPTLCIIALCGLSLLLTGASYLASCFAARFVRYRLNGTAAGILNASYGFALVIQYTLFSRLAESSWRALTVLWCGLIILSAILIALAIRPSIRFKRQIHE